MLGKLLKHEFIATGRTMWIIYAAMAALSLFANISLKTLDRPGVPNVVKALMILILVLWGLSLVFAMAATLVLMLKRFQKNLLTDEGYLMFTLPANVHQLLLAKLIAAAVWLLATMAMIALCVAIAVMSTAFLRNVSMVIQSLLDELNLHYAVNGTMIVVELLLLLVIGCGVSCLQFYSAMSIGHGFTSHKALWSVVFYFIQSTVLQIIGTILASGLTETELWQNFDLSTVNGMQAWHLGVLSTCAMEILIGAIFYCLTAWNLKHRLNLS